MSPVFFIVVEVFSEYIPIELFPATFIVPALFAWLTALWTTIPILLFPNNEIEPPEALSILEFATLKSLPRPSPNP